MKRDFIIGIFILFTLVQTVFAQEKTDANIVGHIVCCEEHIGYANVTVKGTTIGTTTDETGHYKLTNLPAGELTIAVTIIGYKPQEKVVTTEAGKTIELNFELEEDMLNLEEMVVSADRSQIKRVEAPIIVTTISPKIFTSTQSNTLGEGLNFTPGLRLENDCQNCGFSQVRMNGMEGPYSQILINSRPIFSGLAGVYGLELIPANMIERVEVVRGGGSALYGSNAIAGTINIIMKEPTTNSYEVGTNYALTGVGVDGSAGPASDYSINFNTSIVSNNNQTGMSLYGNTRERTMFDANDDGFSELSPLQSITLGSRLYHRISKRDKITVDFFSINEDRDGGNMQEYPLHERDVAEAVEHDLKVGGLTYERFFREHDLLSVYASGQFLNRDSYYGAEQSLSDYGNTKDKTINAGFQYKANFEKSSLIAGAENTSDFLVDTKLGYPEYSASGDSVIVTHTENTTVSDQALITTGAFAQYDIKFEKLKISIGGRFDHYSVQDYANDSSGVKKGNVFSPRASIMYRILEELQGRISYSQGFRAPQIFDEDLHIETSGSRQVINQNDPDLKQETSHSFMASLDYNGLIGTMYTGLLVEGFYTRLTDPFVNEIGEADEDGTVIYTRVNAEGGATVQGVNIEFKLKPLKSFMLSSGFTIQSSEYDEEQEFNETRFFRTPNDYGYFSIDWDLAKNFCVSASGNYTGSMLVPYFGTETDENGELRESDSFFDLGLKLQYTMDVRSTKLQFLAGIKNILNSYQSDFDTGINRDPAYIYGPTSPRTVYFGVKFGNFKTK